MEPWNNTAHLTRKGFCHLSDEQLSELQQRIAGHINETEDHVRYYGMCKKDVSKIVVDGPGNVSIDPDFVML